jgi:hypothetical protein
MTLASKGLRARRWWLGGMALLVVAGGCSLGPEKLTEKCEKDLKTRYGLTGYTRKYKTGFITISEGVNVEVLAFQFFYDGNKGTSIAEQEQDAPTLKGRAYCRIDKKTKAVKTTFEPIADFAGEG